MNRIYCFENKTDLDSRSRSYGIILYNKISKKYVIVKRKDSLCFLNIICGSYKTNEHFKILLKKINHEELEILKDINNELEYKNLFYQLGYKYYDIKQYYKFKINKIYLEDIPISINDKRDWNFSKGKKNNKYECEINTAFREFYEETGLNLLNCNDLELTNLNYYCITFNLLNKYYISKFYICIVENEYHIFDNDKIEVSEVQWVNFDELKILLNIDNDELDNRINEYIENNIENNIENDIENSINNNIENNIVNNIESHINNDIENNIENNIVNDIEKLEITN